MDKQAFKQRMQNLKSYRENNPGKGYWDWKVEAFADGGQTGDPEKERFYQATGRSSSGRPLYVFINSDYVKNGKLQPGLISHEKSHYDNQKAGALSLPIFDNRFIDTKKTKTMYPKTYDWIQRYLHNFEETKSHMNEFRTNMINKNLLKPDSKVGLKQIKDLIFNSDNDNIKKLFNTYKSKRQFVKDFNSVPITSIGDNKTLV